MTPGDRARGPVRVPRWPEAAAEEPDFAAIRAEFGVPEEFPADVLRTIHRERDGELAVGGLVTRAAAVAAGDAVTVLD